MTQPSSSRSASWSLVSVQGVSDEEQGEEEEAGRELVLVVNRGEGEREAARKGEGKRVMEERWQKEETKTIAYERQLAPLMARETKQKSGASSSNTIKPTVCSGLSRAARRGVRRPAGGRDEVEEIKSREGTMAREPPRAALLRCCLPLSDVAVFASPSRRSPSTLFPPRFPCSSRSVPPVSLLLLHLPHSPFFLFASHR